MYLTWLLTHAENPSGFWVPRITKRLSVIDCKWKRKNKFSPREWHRNRSTKLQDRPHVQGIVENFQRDSSFLCVIVVVGFCLGNFCLVLCFNWFLFLVMKRQKREQEHKVRWVRRRRGYEKSESGKNWGRKRL